MAVDPFDGLASELISLMASPLANRSLNAVATTCHQNPGISSLTISTLSKRFSLLHTLSTPTPAARIGDPTTLRTAVGSYNSEIAALLLDAGADPNQNNSRRLRLAANNRDLRNVLLDYGAGIDLCYGPPSCVETVPHHACEKGCLEVVQLLLERGADKDILGHSGTALGFAVMGRKVDVFRLLLAKGAKAA
ncbi:hypothetical protein C8J57DRAFT_1706176 [Mycena rebaudengoi]|nr:hypothetical protein C8J57DRAFT_1706176 [Mycena rebaudengoi]